MKTKGCAQQAMAQSDAEGIGRTGKGQSLKPEINHAEVVNYRRI
jgi:hypothetical protein